MLVRQVLFLGCFCSLCIVWCEGAATAVLEPLSYVALLNQTVKPVFSCTVHDANYASWEINGQPDLVDRANERQRRGIETDHERVEGMSRSYHTTLKLSPNMVNQYTVIRCWAAVRDGSGPSVPSATTIYQVQGLLGEPQNVTILPFNLTHTVVHWQPPYTLNITDVEPDILQYTTCVSITAVTQYCFNSTTLGELVLPNLNVRKVLNVSAWNALGRGDTAELSVDACEPQDITGIEALVEIVEFQEIKLFITFNSSVDCFDNINITQNNCFCLYNLTLTPLNNGNTTHNIGPLIPIVYWSKSYSIVVPTGHILPNEQYRAELTCVSGRGAGDHDSTPNTTVFFNSFDVQEVSLEINEENLTLLICCKFALGSQAQGCQIHITTNPPGEGQQQQEVTMRNLTRQNNDVMTCWGGNKVLRGTSYTISVYDLERGGSVDTTKIVYSTVVFLNTSNEDHNNDTVHRGKTITTTEPNKEGTMAKTTSSRDGVDLGGLKSTTLYIIVACCSAAVFLTSTIVLLIVCCCYVTMGKRKKMKGKKGVVYSTNALIRKQNEVHTEEHQMLGSTCFYDQKHFDNDCHTTVLATTSFGEKSQTPSAQFVQDTDKHTTHCIHSSDNPSPVQCPSMPLYRRDHPKKYDTVYDQVAQTPPHPQCGTSSNSSVTIHNESYSTVNGVNTIPLETNVAYGCAPKQPTKQRSQTGQVGRRFKVNPQRPLPPLPLHGIHNSSSGHRTISMPAEYETVNNV